MAITLEEVLQLSINLIARAEKAEKLIKDLEMQNKSLTERIRFLTERTQSNE